MRRRRGAGVLARAAAQQALERLHRAAAGGRDGLGVWTEQGCGSCHALAAANSHGFLGPDLASSLKALPATYIRDSIVAPDKAAAAGYTTGMMPEDYASRIAAGDLDRLVSFLQASARR